jgi:integration host factor subunit alpha
MAGKTVTRDDVYDAVRQQVGLSVHECKVLVEQVLGQIISCLVGGKRIKLSGFGLFSVHHKRERLGRNPKTSEPAPISARWVVSFKPSRVLKDKLSSPRRGFPATTQHQSETTT